MQRIENLRLSETTIEINCSDRARTNLSIIQSCGGRTAYTELKLNNSIVEDSREEWL